MTSRVRETSRGDGKYQCFIEFDVFGWFCNMPNVTLVGFAKCVFEIFSIVFFFRTTKTGHFHPGNLLIPCGYCGTYLMQTLGAIATYISINV